MNDFEQKLKAIPLARPSSELRERVFGSIKRGHKISRLVFYRLPLGWAAAIAVFMWILGAYTSMAIERAKSPANTVVNVQIIKSESGRNAFDFTTQPSSRLLPGELTVDVEPAGEVF